MINKNDDYFVHSSSFVDNGAQVGKGTRIWHFCHLMSGAIVGENCNIGQNVFIGSVAILGNGVKVQNNVSIYSTVVCEDDVFLGPSMVFTNVINPRAFIERKDEFLPTLIKQGATVGANATIVCGVTIGKYAMIGAGAVVSKDVPNYALVYGNPGKIQGWVCKCGEKLNFLEKNAQCQACSLKYKITETNIVEMFNKEN